jgi:xanthine dehydrogenase YagR molybdenum-binding subunit
VQDTSGREQTSQQHPTDSAEMGAGGHTSTKVPELGGNGSFGLPTPRRDGPLKVTGGARYAADHPVKRVVHAVAIQSTIANGRVKNIDASAAEKAPGFLAILNHGKTPKLYRPSNDFMSASKPGEIRVVFEDDKVYYAGQYIALVVAETLQQANYAASQVKIDYDSSIP